MPEVAEAPPITNAPPKNEVPPPPDPEFVSEPVSEPQDTGNGTEPSPTPTPEDQEPNQPETEQRSVQSQELQTVSRAAIYRKMNEVQREVDGKTNEEKDAIQKSDKGKAAFLEMHAVETENGGKEFHLIPPRKIGDRYITLLIPMGNGKFSYMYKTDLSANEAVARKEPDENGQEEEPLLERDDLLKEVLLQDADNIENLLPEDQRELFRTHVAILRDGNTALEDKTLEELNALIDQGAEQANMLTNDALLAFAKTNLPPEQLKELLPILTTGGRLATAEGLTKVLEMGGIEELAVKQVADIKSLESRLQYGNLDGPTRKALEQELAVAREYEIFFNQARDVLLEGTKMQELIDNITKGQVDADNAKAITAALKSGDIEEVVKVLFNEFNDDPNDTPEQRAEKKLKQAEAAKRAKMIGGIGLLALLMIIMAGGELQKNIR